MRKKHTSATLLALVLIASALACVLTILIISGRYRGEGQISLASREYEELLRKIEKEYIGDYDTETIAAAAMRAAVIELGDRWSFYMTPQEYASFIDRSNNQYRGIGVGVSTDDTALGMRILFVYKNSPAEASGIVEGDIVTTVDGISVAGLEIDEIRDLLARPINEVAVLDVLHADGMSSIISVAYNYIYVDPVAFELLDGGVGYIVIANFDYGVGDSFIAAIDALLEQGAQGMIFDVRSNNGGRVVEMTKMLDYLLPEGDIFISVNKQGVEDITRSDSSMVKIPAVTIVDANSYSAAEYFSAMLREYDYAQVVGERTTGKNRMQQTFPLSNGGALHISISQYLTKNRVSLYDAGGLAPDYEVVLSEEEYARLVSGNLPHEDDPQLQAAIELLLRL